MKKLISIFSFSLLSFSFYSQGGVSINNTGNPPNTSAMLDVSSTDKGVLVPRVALTAINIAAPVVTPQVSLLVYNTATSGVTPNDVVPGFYYWDGSVWVKIVSGSIVGTDSQGLTSLITGGNATVNISGGTGTTFSINDADSDPLNEIELPATAGTGQVLTYDGTNWVAQNAGSGADNWGTQTVVTGGTGFSGNGTNTTPLTYTEVDGSTSNEINTGFNISGGNLNIIDSGGTLSVPLNTINTDNQDLTLTGNTLSLTNDATTVNLASYLDNTDSQNLTSSVTTGNATVNISGGTGTTFSINDADSNPLNEMNTGLTVSGGNLNVVDANSTQSVALSQINANDWHTIGNAATTPATNFLGTTDGQDLVIRTNNTEKMRVMSNGDIGIGTATPSHKLQIQGNINSTQNVFNVNFNNGNSSYASFIAGTSLSSIQMGMLSPLTTAYPIIGKQNEGFITVAANSGVINILADSSIVINNAGNSSAPTARFDNRNHRLGIGTLTPIEKLHVKGEIKSEFNGNNRSGVLLDPVISDLPKISFRASDNTNRFEMVSKLNVNNGLDKLHIRSLSNLASPTDTLITFEANGNMGIGTTAPSSKLHVQDGDIMTHRQGGFPIVGVNSYSNVPTQGPHFIGFRSRGTQAAPTFSQSGDLLATFQGREVNGITIGLASLNMFSSENHTAAAQGTLLNFITTQNGTTIPTTKLTILGDGNTGVGTPNPSVKLDVAGNVSIGKDEDYINNSPFVSNTYGNLLKFSGVAFNTDPVWIAKYNLASDQTYMRFNVGDNVNISDAFQFGQTSSLPGGFETFMHIGTNGNVGIGTTAPTQRLTVFNGISTGTYTTTGWIHTSDSRLKTNITPIDGSLEKIQQIQGVNFDWKEDNSKRQIGFLAQDLQKILPEAVVVDSEGNYGVAYGNLTPLLVEALKEQQAIIDELKKSNLEINKNFETQKEVINSQSASIDFLMKEVNGLKTIVGSVSEK